MSLTGESPDREMSATGESLDREKSGQEMFPAGKCLRPGNVRPGKDWRGNVINRGMFGEGKSGRGLATGKNRSAIILGKKEEEERSGASSIALQ